MSDYGHRVFEKAHPTTSSTKSYSVYNCREYLDSQPTHVIKSQGHHFHQHMAGRSYPNTNPGEILIELKMDMRRSTYRNAMISGTMLCSQRSFVKKKGTPERIPGIIGPWSRADPRKGLNCYM